jgi:hypothetical protein
MDEFHRKIADVLEIAAEALEDSHTGLSYLSTDGALRLAVWGTEDAHLPVGWTADAGLYYAAAGILCGYPVGADRVAGALERLDRTGLTPRSEVAKAAREEAAGLRAAFSGTTADRCPAAHGNDPTPCSGPIAVTVLDAEGAGLDGCEHHGARTLASLRGGRVHPLPDAPDGAAIRVHKAAGLLLPFPWMVHRPEGQS